MLIFMRYKNKQISMVILFLLKIQQGLNVAYLQVAIPKTTSSSSSSLSLAASEKKGKGRTGWPQHVWALELKQ